MTEQRVYTVEEFEALPEEEKVPGMLLDIVEEDNNHLTYTFDMVTDQNGKVFFDEKKIPANINETFGFGTEFYTLSDEETDEVVFDPKIVLGQKVNNMQPFSASFICNKPNTPVRITFEYL